MSNNYLKSLKAMYHQEDENRLFKKYDIEAVYHRYTQRLAYYLWEKAGKPDNMSDHFWFEAESMCNRKLAPWTIDLEKQLDDFRKSLEENGYAILDYDLPIFYELPIIEDYDFTDFNYSKYNINKDFYGKIIMDNYKE